MDKLAQVHGSTLIAVGRMLERYEADVPRLTRALVGFELLSSLAAFRMLLDRLAQLTDEQLAVVGGWLQEYNNGIEIRYVGKRSNP